MDQATLIHQVRDLWRRLEPIYAQFTPYPEYFELRSVEFLLLVLRLRRLFDPPHWGRILEVGCGNGFGLTLWSLLADEVTGVDAPEVLSGARRLIEHRSAGAGQIRLVEGECEDLSQLQGRYDLIVTQYAFEHFRDQARSVAQLRGLLAPGGHAVHILPNVVDRQSWYLDYRATVPWWARLRESLRRRGWHATLRDPFGHTPPHDAGRGDFESERRKYSLEKWAALFMRNDEEILDYFPTRDINWVLVTRPLALADPKQ